MIRLAVEEYCHSCFDFAPDVMKPQKVRIAEGSEVHLTDTIVQCEHRKRCASIKRYLEQQIRGDANEVQN